MSPQTSQEWKALSSLLQDHPLAGAAARPAWVGPAHSPGIGRLGEQYLQGAWHRAGHKAGCQALVANPAL